MDRVKKKARGQILRIDKAIRDTNGVNDGKKETLRQMFANSHVAMIYGSAGTGNSTLINHDARLQR